MLTNITYFCLKRVGFGKAREFQMELVPFLIAMFDHFGGMAKNSSEKTNI